MSDPHRLVITLTMPSGQEYRWAPDERDTENVPSGLTFGSTVPGGFSTATFTLPRGVIRDYPDEALFANVRITGPGGVVAWEGRVASLPREQGSSRTLTVGAVGHAAALKDNQGVRELIIDRAQSRWGDGTLERRAEVEYPTGTYSLAGPSSTPSGLSLQISDGGWDANARPLVEAWYDAAGVPIGSIYYEWAKSATLNSALTDWWWNVKAANGRAAFTADTSGNLRGAGPGTGATLSATASDRVFGLLQLFYDAAGGTAASNLLYTVDWPNLAVIGNHGLTKTGTEPSAGFLLSDLVSYLIPKWAPSLTVGDVETTAFPISQAAYLDPTDLESVVMDLNKFELKRWGVWAGRRFDMWTGSPATRTVWEARLSDGAQLQLEGDDADSVAAGVIVRFTDPNGVQRTIGPTGYAPADATYDDLLVTDPTNPAVAAGIAKYPVLTLSFSTDFDGAKKCGTVYLAEQLLPQRRGSVTLQGLVKHPTEGMVPAWRMRAGDFVRIADRPGDVAREITQVGYTHDSHVAQCSVGGLPATVDALFERVGVRTIQ